MHKKFDSGAIEKKWQQVWREQGIYNVGERDEGKEKQYVLVEWPYPSGNLHIGHWYAFAVPDIYVRQLRMEGKQVLYPMGFDAFGLPAENAAIKRNINPREWTESNIAFMKGQLESMGNAFSWDKTTSSTDPEYYRWTQWMFTQFFESNIAYRGEGVVNWCPGCNTVIANEQVLADGTCERSGDLIEKRTMPQWMLRITDFADALIDDLEPLNWPEHIKEAQRQWIGRSKGAEIDFKLSTGDTVTVFTTRPDTLFGATYLVLAPEHPLIEKGIGNIQNREEVRDYVIKAKQRDEHDRLDATKEKTGVKLEGVTATNPANGEEIPVFVADYVLGGYGTGAIMAVPAHDARDFAFASKFTVPIRQVVASVFNKLDTTGHRTGVYGLIKNEKNEYLLQYFKNAHFFWIPGGGCEEGESELDCLKREIAEETRYSDFKIIKKIDEMHYDFISRSGNKRTNHTHVYVLEITADSPQQPVTLTDLEKEDGLELRWIGANDIDKALNEGVQSRSNVIRQAIALSNDNVYTGQGRLTNSGEFDGMDSEEAKEAIVKKVGGRMTNTYRLRDWSVGRQRYWGVPIPIVYDPQGNAHPVPEEHLPWTLPEDVDFKPTGEAPLAKSAELKERTERIFGAGWTPEVETMDTFVDSSWYFLRYIDNKNDTSLSSLDAQKTWMPIDIYFGGAEHTTMHLLYSRFWQKALLKLGHVVHGEPYLRRINRSLILGPDGNKMSKSKGNVIDPDEQVARVGSDTVKMYLAFMGPYGETGSYPWDMGGIAGIRRFLERVNGLSEHITATESENMTRAIHKTIKKVQGDIHEFKFNTAISAMMVYLNAAEKEGMSEASYETFLKVLAPFAPHLCEELWSARGKTGSIHTESVPTYDTALVATTTVTIGVQVNGKLRGNVTLAPDAEEAVAVAAARSLEAVEKWLEGSVAKVIYVPGKILNFIVQK